MKKVTSKRRVRVISRIASPLLGYVKIDSSVNYPVSNQFRQSGVDYTVAKSSLIEQVSKDFRSSHLRPFKIKTIAFN